MKYHYFVTKSNIKKGYPRTAYGIAAVADEGGCSVFFADFPDLSSEEASIRRLCCLCNELKLDPIHLRDIAEDFVINLSFMPNFVESCMNLRITA